MFFRKFFENLIAIICNYSAFSATFLPLTVSHIGYNNIVGPLQMHPTGRGGPKLRRCHVTELPCYRCVLDVFESKSVLLLFLLVVYF